VRLGELFGPGKDSLIVYSFMFPRDAADDRPGPAEGETARLPITKDPCPSCTALLDQLDGAVEHAQQWIEFVAVAKAPLRHILTLPASGAGVACASFPRPRTATTATISARRPRATSDRC
jgi:predicted dithiol-disulfide oxidoreductase (DUF899 family)